MENSSSQDAGDGNTSHSRGILERIDQFHHEKCLKSLKHTHTHTHTHTQTHTVKNHKTKKKQKPSITKTNNYNNNKFAEGNAGSQITGY